MKHRSIRNRCIAVLLALLYFMADVQAVEILTAAYSKTSPRSDAAGTFCHPIPQNSQKPLFKIVR